MQPPRPKVKIASEVIPVLREETGNRRNVLLQALFALFEDLPREAGGFLDAVSPAGFQHCFVWSRILISGERQWRLAAIVNRAGWPNLLWVVDVFVRELEA